MGGFNAPELSIINAPSYTIVGKPYTGRMNSKEFGKLFEEADSLIKSGTIKGVSCAWFENNPESGKDTVKAFVGVATTTSPSALPKGFEVKTTSSRKVVQAHILAHYMLAPQTYSKLKDFADSKNIKVNDAPTLELYNSENDVIIQQPVKE